MKEFIYNLFLIFRGIVVVVILYILAGLAFVVIGGTLMDIFIK